MTKTCKQDGVEPDFTDYALVEDVVFVRTLTITLYPVIAGQSSRGIARAREPRMSRFLLAAVALFARHTMQSPSHLIQR
jgi:hypothetical protein